MNARPTLAIISLALALTAPQSAEAAPDVTPPDAPEIWPLIGGLAAGVGLSFGACLAATMSRHGSSALDGATGWRRVKGCAARAIGYESMEVMYQDPCALLSETIMMTLPGSEPDLTEREWCVMGQVLELTCAYEDSSDEFFEAEIRALGLESDMSRMSELLAEAMLHAFGPGTAFIQAPSTRLDTLDPDTIPAPQLADLAADSMTYTGKAVAVLPEAEKECGPELGADAYDVEVQGDVWSYSQCESLLETLEEECATTAETKSESGTK